MHGQDISLFVRFFLSGFVLQIEGVKNKFTSMLPSTFFFLQFPLYRESRDRRQVFGPFAALAINHGTYFESKEKITWLSENTIDFLCTYLSQSSLVLY